MARIERDTETTRRRPAPDEAHVAYGYAGDAPVGVRDRVRWGPIVAGLFTTLTTLVLLTLLGVAIGLSAFEPGEVGEDVATGAAIWGGIALLLAFFVGGWVAGSTAGLLGAGNGTFNGLMVGVTAIVVTIWLVGSGLGNILGAAGANIGELSQIAGTADVPEGEQVLDQARAAYDDAVAGTWGTFISLALALAAAAVGGLVGSRKHVDVDAAPARSRRAEH